MKQLNLKLHALTIFRNILQDSVTRYMLLWKRMEVVQYQITGEEFLWKCMKRESVQNAWYLQLYMPEVNLMIQLIKPAVDFMEWVLLL